MEKYKARVTVVVEGEATTEEEFKILCKRVVSIVNLGGINGNARPSDTPIKIDMLTLWNVGPKLKQEPPTILINGQCQHGIPIGQQCDKCHPIKSIEEICKEGLESSTRECDAILKAVEAGNKSSKGVDDVKFKKGSK